MPKILTQLPSTVDVKPTWTRGPLIFRFKSGLVHCEASLIYSTLAVHASLKDENSKPHTVVTHIQSYISIVRVYEPADAARCAERLWDECKAAFIGEVIDIDKIPEATRKWMIECTKQRRYI